MLEGFLLQLLLAGGVRRRTSLRRVAPGDRRRSAPLRAARSVSAAALSFVWRPGSGRSPPYPVHAPPGRARTLVLERRTVATGPVSAVCRCAPPLAPRRRKAAHRTENAQRQPKVPKATLASSNDSLSLVEWVQVRLCPGFWMAGRRTCIFGDRGQCCLQEQLRVFNSRCPIDGLRLPTS